MQLIFEDAYIQYLEYIDIKQKNQSKRSVKDVFKNHILPFWGKFDIYNLNSNDYIKWLQQLREKDFKYSYVKKIYYTFSGFLEYCINFQGLNKNIAKQIGFFKNEIVDTISHNIYTPKQFSKFINQEKDKIYKLFFKVLYLCGTRPGETMAFKFSDLTSFKLSVNTNIEEHIDKTTNKRNITTPKNKSSIRTFNIDIILYFELLSLKKYYQNKYNYFNEDFFIFGGIKPLSPTSIRRHIKNNSKKGRIPYIKPHEFRHSHASYLYHRHIPITEIAKRLGHSNIYTTINTYIHSYKNEEKRVTRTLSLLRIFRTF